MFVEKPRFEWNFWKCHITLYLSKMAFLLQITHIKYVCRLKSLHGPVSDMRVIDSPPLPSSIQIYLFFHRVCVSVLTILIVSFQYISCHIQFVIHVSCGVISYLIHYCNICHLNEVFRFYNSIIMPHKIKGKSAEI